MDTSDVIGFLLVGVIFAACGAITVIRGETSIGFGGGRTAGSPLFHVELNRTSAIVLGIFLLIGGGLIAFPSIYQIISANEILADWVWLRILGIVSIIIGTIFSSVIQSAISMGENIHQRRRSGNSRSDEDVESQ